MLPLSGFIARRSVDCKFCFLLSKRRIRQLTNSDLHLCPLYTLQTIAPLPRLSLP